MIAKGQGVQGIDHFMKTGCIMPLITKDKHVVFIKRPGKLNLYSSISGFMQPVKPSTPPEEGEFQEHINARLDPEAQRLWKQVSQLKEQQYYLERHLIQEKTSDPTSPKVKALDIRLQELDQQIKQVEVEATWLAKHESTVGQQGHLSVGKLDN